MANATRAKNDNPDTLYFDDWFAKVPVSELIGKTLYIDPECFFIDAQDKEVRKRLIDMGVTVMTKKDFDPTKCDYIAVFTGWMKTRKAGLKKEDKLAWNQWKKTGAPLRLYWKHIYDEVLGK